MTTEDPMRVPKVGRDEKVKQNPPDSPLEEPKDDSALAAGAFFSWLRGILGFLDKQELATTASGELKTVLSQIKKYLQQLKEDDQTGSPSFTAQFSLEWNKLLSLFDEMRPKSFFYAPLKKLIDALNDFPSGEQHRFGYYLTHYAGEKWLPFPYLDILRALHRDYLVKGPASDLHRWLELVSDILGT